MKTWTFVLAMGLLASQLGLASDIGDYKGLLYAAYALKPADGQTKTIQGDDLKALVGGSLELTDSAVSEVLGQIDHIELKMIDEKKAASGQALEVKVITLGHKDIKYFKTDCDENSGEDCAEAAREAQFLRIQNGATAEIFIPTTQAAIERVNEKVVIAGGGAVEDIYRLFDKSGDTPADVRQDQDEVGDDYRKILVDHINQIASGGSQSQPILETELNGVNLGINGFSMLQLDYSSAIVIPDVKDPNWPASPMIVSISHRLIKSSTNPFLKLIHGIPVILFRQEQLF